MVHPLDVGKNRFRKLVGESDPVRPILPMVHSTDTFALVDILEDGKIHPQNCPVFTGERLTYLFYGRPAFRPDMNAEPTSLKHYYPVCLIFKSNWQTIIRRAFPFDSGAFRNGFYDAYLHSKMKLGDFGLEIEQDTPGRVVGRFFGSVPAYLTARPQTTDPVDPSEFEAHSYLALINAKEGNSIDSRGSGIEVQTAETLSISNAVAAIVLPAAFVKGKTGEKLKALGIDPLPYNTYDRTRPSEYMSQITDICFHYYVRTELIKESDI